MTETSQRRPPIAVMDGIRGWACLIVLAVHAAIFDIIPIASQKYLLGKIAVILFFVLSGFMMMYHYHTLHQCSWRFWTAFCARRFFRIYPPFAFTVVLFCFFPAYSKMNPSLLPNYLLGRNLHYFHFWTIPPEMMFYIIFPLLSLAVFLLPINRIGKTAFLAGVLGLLCWLHYNRCINILDYNLERLVKNNMQYFLVGMLAAYIHTHFQLKQYVAQSVWNLGTLLAIGLLVVCLEYYVLFMTGEERWILYYFDAMPFKLCKVFEYVALIAMMVLMLAPHCTGLPRFIMGNRFVRYCGTISYSLYLIHPLVYAIFVYFFNLKGPMLFVIGVGSAFLTGIIMHHLIEKPSNRIGKRLSEKILSG